MNSRRRRSKRRRSAVPRHIREQWLPGNVYRYTDPQLGCLFLVSVETIRKDRQRLHLRKYITDDYQRPAR